MQLRQLAVHFHIYNLEVASYFPFQKPKDKTSPKGIGIGLLLFSMIILFTSIVSFYLIKTYKPVAALAGADNIYKIIKS